MTDYRTAEGVARRRVENELRRRNLLLDAINRVFQEALTCESEADVANACLVVAEQLTDSRFGFLGIINSAGRFDTIALSDPGWQACRMPETQAVVLIRNMEVRGIWSKPISQEKPVIVNEPDSDPDRVGVPEGHPAITCYLGIPLKHGGKTIGLIGLANRESGYEENNQADIEALAVAFVEALCRKRAEVELRKAHDELEMRVQERTSELGTANAALKKEIADRKEAEQALGASEERFRNLAETVDDVVWATSLDGLRMLYINPAAEHVYGRPCPEFSENPDLWLEVVHPEDRARVEQSARQLLDQGWRETEYRIIRADGEVRWLLDRARVILDPAGNPSHIGGIASDVTKLKRVQKRLEAQEQFLKELLNLQERERKLIAHEIHDGFVQDVVSAKMLLEGASRELRLQHCLGIDRLEPVDDLLNRVVAEARRMIGELRPMIIDEEGIIEAIRHLVAEGSWDPQPQVELSLPSELGPLDPMLEGTIFRIVQEALTNVRRHSQSETVAVELTCGKGRLRLEVRDHGVGFEPSQLSKKRFGLRGIKERARLFGGHATIESAPGKGTRIVVELPMLQPTTGEAEKRLGR